MSRPRTPRSLVALVATIVLGSMSASAEIGESSIVWTEDPERAFAVAGETGRPVLVNVHADWCAPCHVMDAETYGNAEVIQRAGAFVALKIDADLNEAFADRYDVTLLPTTLILTSNGKEVLKVRGVIGASEMLELFGRVDDGWDAYLDAIQRPADPQALETVATYLAKLGNRAESRKALNLAAALLRSSGAEPVRVQSVEIKLAQASLASGEWRSATAEFDRLANDGASREIRAMALVGLMDVHRSRGRSTEAAEVLEVLQRDYPDAIEALGL